MIKGDVLRFEKSEIIEKIKTGRREGKKTKKWRELGAGGRGEK